MRSITASRYIVLVAVVVPFLATLFAIWLLWERAVHWSDLILLATMYAFITLGVGVGFHRMLTHRSFQPHPIVKFILLVLGSMSLEGPAHNVYRIPAALRERYDYNKKSAEPGGLGRSLILPNKTIK